MEDADGEGNKRSAGKNRGSRIPRKRGKGKCRKQQRKRERRPGHTGPVGGWPVMVYDSGLRGDFWHYGIFRILWGSGKVSAVCEESQMDPGAGDPLHGVAVFSWGRLCH